MEDRGLLNKTTDEIEADRSVPKIVILAAAGIIFSFAFGYFLKLFIFQGRLDFLLFCFLAALGFLIFFLLEVLFVKTSWIVSLIIFLETLGFLAPFYNHLSKTVAIGTLISFLIFLSGVYIGRAELGNMLKVKFWRISKKTLPKAIAGLALFSSIIYVGVIGSGEKEFFISQATFEKVIEFVPGFDLSLPVETLIKNLAVNQIEGNAQLKLLPESAKKELINQSVKELEKKISDFTGIPLNPKVKASEALYGIMKEKFTNLPENVRLFTPAAVAAIIFLTIIGLSLPIRLIATVLAFLIYEICLALGFSAIIMEGRSREIIILK